MIFFKPNIIFKLKKVEDSINDCLLRLKTGSNYEIGKIKTYFNNDVSAENIKATIIKNFSSFSDLNKILLEYNEKWESIKPLFINEISKVFCINSGEVNFLCLLDVLPVRYIDFYNKNLSISLYKTFDFNFGFAISLVVKHYVLNKLREIGFEHIDLTYSHNNKYWLMADLVTDSIFYNTQLRGLNIKPAYEYFYSLKIGGENVIEKIRNSFSFNNFEDFILHTLEYVSNNYEMLDYFKNRY